LEKGPKSFWATSDRVVDESERWVTHYDHEPSLAVEAEIIHACGRGQLPLPVADEMELWEIAAYLGLHRIETVGQRDQREIVETKAAYWEETREARSAKVNDYATQRREAKIRRQQEKARQREGRVEVVGGTQ
jgi:hypothetical protein